MSSAFGNVWNPCYLGQTSVLKNKATQQAFQGGLCPTLFALVRWKWLSKTTYSKPCSEPGLWPLQGAGLPGSVSSASSWLFKVTPRNPLPSMWGMWRGSNLHQLLIAASWPCPQNWLILIWQYTLISCLPAKSHSRETEKQMGHKSKTSLFPKCKSVYRNSLWCICMSLLHESIEWAAAIYCTQEMHLLGVSPLLPSRYRFSKAERRI